MTKIIAITGGIGSGKSVISCILRIMKYHVYDCDFNAKMILNNSPIVKEKLKAAYGESIFLDEEINRKKLASIVFSDKNKLQILNSIVHPIVKQDIKNWVSGYSSEKILFFETAILEESGLDSIIDGAIIVNAPEEIRIQRVIKRNNISYDEVKQRINNQRKKSLILNNTFHINNDGNSPLIPQVINILNLINQHI